MPSCRELAAKIAAEEDPDKKSALQEELKTREKAFRDPLKSKEKALRGKESTPLKDLVTLQEECEKELPEDDSILKRVRASVYSKESHFQELFEAKLSSKKSLTFKVLDDLMTAVEEQLGSAKSEHSRELIARVSSLLEARRKSHRAPLAKELAALKETGTMKELIKLKNKALLELSESDDVLKDIIAAEKARDASVRTKLVTRFTSLIKDIKKTKSSAVHDFLKECEAELDDNDALLSQVRSTLENKMLESKGMKVVHNMDDVERGEREKVTDDAPVSRSSKKASSSSKSESSSSKKKSSSSSKSKGGSSSISPLKSSVVTSAVEVLSGFKSDLSGAPPTSAFYKLGIILVFLMYLSIVAYSTSLAFKVAKVEIDVSRVTNTFSMVKSSAADAAAATATATQGAAAAVTKSSGAAAPKASSSSSSAASSSSSSDGGSGGDDDAGGGGDDDD